MQRASGRHRRNGSLKTHLAEGNQRTALALTQLSSWQRQHRKPVELVLFHEPPHTMDFKGDGNFI